MQIIKRPEIVKNKRVAMYFELINQLFVHLHVFKPEVSVQQTVRQSRKKKDKKNQENFRKEPEKKKTKKKTKKKLSILYIRIVHTK